MNPKKPLSETPWMRRELEALRAGEPNPAAIDQTVERVLAASPAPVRKVTFGRALPLAAGLGVGALLLFVMTQPAEAASLQRIAEAMRHQTTRHAKTYRPAADGTLALTNEDWIDGNRSLETFFAADGERTQIGYDGQRMFRVSSKSGGFVDDVAPSGLPLESIDAYLNNPATHVSSVVRGDGQDIYTVEFSNVRFKLYVDPATRLPMRRDVLTLKGRLIERNQYDYPSRLSPDLFRPPADLADYPALRRELAVQLAGQGQTKEVGGVKIALKAVIVGESSVMALWTGGARADGFARSDMWIEGMPKPPVGGLPQPFTVSSSADGALRGNVAWYPNLRLKAPFTINIPVWAKDPARAGEHRKLVGRLTFRVAHPIQAPDPERVVWRPSGGVGTAKTADATP